METIYEQLLVILMSCINIIRRIDIDMFIYYAMGMD